MNRLFRKVSDFKRAARELKAIVKESLLTGESPQSIVKRRVASGELEKGIAIVILLILVGATFPAALTSIFTANTSGWGSSGQALWPVVGLGGEIAALVLIIRSAL